MKPSRSVPISYVLPHWLRAPALPILVAAEIRAIFPVWSFALLLIAIAPLLQARLAQAAVILGYGLGCVAIGAIAAGRDFMHRTLGTTLSLPCAREHLWRARLLVSLIGMILLAALLFYIERVPVRGLPIAYVFWFLSPVLSGLLVAPWLTLLCRSALAGTVFTVSLPFLFLLVGGLTSEDAGFKNGVTVLLVVAHWIAGGILGWRKFMRLEAIEGRVGELHLPRWLSRQDSAKSISPPARRRYAFWQLAKKELHLQQMAFVTTGLFLLVWLGVWAVHKLRPNLDVSPIDIATLLYAGLAAILIGSVASAEERQLGTTEWQALLPMSARKQWAVKLVVVLGLALVLAGLLPATLLHHFSWGNDFKDGWPSLARVLCGATMVLAIVGLYFSSVFNSGLKAMLASLPASLGLLAMAGFAIESYRGRLNYYQLVPRTRYPYEELNPWEWLAPWWPLIFLAGLFLLLLRFAFANHRSAERSASRIGRQIACLIACIALSAATWAFYDVTFLDHVR